MTISMYVITIHQRYSTDGRTDDIL